MVPVRRATRMATPTTPAVRRPVSVEALPCRACVSRFCEEGNSGSPIKIGNDKHKPTMGRYRRCSKITSLIGKKLDVGASVRKNHKMENETIGLRLRSNQAKLSSAIKITPDTITPGSIKLSDIRK